jgi:hypothetical protein
VADTISTMDEVHDSRAPWSSSEVSSSFPPSLHTHLFFDSLDKDELFLSLFEKHGRKWRSLANEFNRLTKTGYTYNGDQCMGRYRVLNPDLEKGKWSPEVRTTLLAHCSCWHRRMSCSEDLLSSKFLPKTIKSNLTPSPSRSLVEIGDNVKTDTMIILILPLISHN